MACEREKTRNKFRHFDKRGRVLDVVPIMKIQTLDANNPQWQEKKARLMAARVPFDVLNLNRQPQHDYWPSKNDRYMLRALFDTSGVGFAHFHPLPKATTPELLSCFKGEFDITDMSVD